MGEAKRRRAMAQHMANSFADDIKRDIAKTVRSIEWLLPDRRPAGMCFFRTMFGTITLNRLDIPAKPALGGMIYRAGPDEERDVVAFCGPGQCRDADRVELSRPLVHHVRRRHRRFFGRRLEGANGAGHVAGCRACRRDSARLNSMDRRPTRRNSSGVRATVSCRLRDAIRPNSAVRGTQNLPDKGKDISSHPLQSRDRLFKDLKSARNLQEATAV